MRQAAPPPSSSTAPFEATYDDPPLAVLQQAEALMASSDLLSLVRQGDAAALLAARLAFRADVSVDRAALLQSVLRWVNDTDILRRELAIRAAFASRHHVLINAVLPELLSPVVQTRAGAIRAMAFAQEPLAITPLLSLIALGDVCAPLAMWAIGEIGVASPLAEKVLLDAHQARFCPEAALLALGKMGTRAIFSRVLLAAHRDGATALKAAFLLSKRHDLSQLSQQERARALSHARLHVKKSADRTTWMLAQCLAARLGEPMPARGS